MDATSIHSINATNDIYMNDDDNFIHRHCAPFFCQGTMKMYLMDYNMIHQNEQFIVIKQYFEYIIKEIKEFWMEGIIVIFFSTKEILSPNMAHISEHINSSNQNKYSHHPRIKTIVSLGSKKLKNNNLLFPTHLST